MSRGVEQSGNLILLFAYAKETCMIYKMTVKAARKVMGVSMRLHDNRSFLVDT